MIIALLLINIIFSAIILVLVSMIKDLNERIEHEIKHSIALEKTIDEYVKE